MCTVCPSRKAIELVLPAGAPPCFVTALCAGMTRSGHCLCDELTTCSCYERRPARCRGDQWRRKVRWCCNRMRAKLESAHGGATTGMWPCYDQRAVATTTASDLQQPWCRRLQPVTTNATTAHGDVVTPVRERRRAQVLEAARLFSLEAASWIAGTVVTRCYHGDSKMLPQVNSRMLRPRATTCRNRVHRMLQRRLSNAASTTPPAGMVAIGCYHGDRWLQRKAATGGLICWNRLQPATASSSIVLEAGGGGRPWEACVSGAGRKGDFSSRFLLGSDGQTCLDLTPAR